MLAAGLATVMISACEIVGQAALVERAGNEAGLESFTNKLASVDDTASGGGDGGEALMHEARTLWADEAGGAQAKHAAVLALLGAVLGMPAPAPPSESFATNGDNSFVAMQAIGAVRAELGVGVPVFELLTKTFGAFADAVLAKAGGHDTLDVRSWVVAVDESAPQQGRAAAQSASTFVFFPQAGASPSSTRPSSPSCASPSSKAATSSCNRRGAMRGRTSPTRPTSAAASPRRPPPSSRTS
jgi:hypothetical protein